MKQDSEDFAKIEFKYTNEYGNESTMSTTFDMQILTESGETPLEYLLERFKTFLKVCEFGDSSIDNIQIAEQ